MKTNLLSLVIAFLFSLSTVAQLTVEEYQLENGFKVILNPDKTTNQVFGAVAVNTGSKNDPMDATGMSHYLEHLLFKGTDQLGTWNYEKEKPLLDSVRHYYDQLGKTKNEDEREAIQRKINEFSVAASQYSMPNEFDKLLKSIGGSGVNATTSNDLTIYFNQFPSHQIEKWLNLYAHRFQNPVFRSFQSELEVVYEEKNRAMDNMQRRLFESFTKEFYKGHPYGEKDNLGTIEHLKNPSLNKMYQYFDDYYKANNMALILCGNFDIEEVKPMIQKYFSKLKSGAIPENHIKEPFAIQGRQVFKTRLTPVKVGMIGFRTVPRYHEDEVTLDVINALLKNESGTGLIDELEKESKLMNAWAWGESMDEAGNNFIIFIPKILVQSLNNAEKLVLEQLEKLKTGAFPDEQLEAIKAELYKSHQLDIEDPLQRGYYFAKMFTNGLSYEDCKTYPQKLASIDKNDIMEVSQKYFNGNYVFMKSKMGFPKKTKLDKPNYKPVEVDQSKQSVFAKAFDKTPSSALEAKFIDFEKDIHYELLDNKNSFYYTKNPINDIYSLDIKIHYGEFNDPKVEVLANCFEFLHPKDLSLKEFKTKLSTLGTNYSVESSGNFFTIKLEGIESNLNASVQLMAQLIEHPELDEKHLKAFKTQFRTFREVEKETPIETARALAQYGLYGDYSLLKKRLSTKDVSALSWDDLLLVFEQLDKHKVNFHFIGKTDQKEIKTLILENFQLEQRVQSSIPHNIPMPEISKNKIMMINNKKLLQSHVFFIKHSNGRGFNAFTQKELFNQYYGGGFSGVLKQEIREYRSLAYSTSGGFRHSLHPDSKNFFFTYVGTQADKTAEAISKTYELIQKLPLKDDRMEFIKQSVKLKNGAEYPNFRSLSSTVEKYKLQKLNQDPNIKLYEEIDKITFDDIINFYQSEIQEGPIFIGIYGDLKRFKNKLDIPNSVSHTIDRKELIEF